MNEGANKSWDKKVYIYLLFIFFLLFVSKGWAADTGNDNLQKNYKNKQEYTYIIFF